MNLILSSVALGMLFAALGTPFVASKVRQLLRGRLVRESAGILVVGRDQEGDNAVLIFKSNPNYVNSKGKTAGKQRLEIPGGKVEQGETFQEAALREWEEETNGHTLDKTNLTEAPLTLINPAWKGDQESVQALFVVDVLNELPAVKTKIREKLLQRGDNKVLSEVYSVKVKDFHALLTNSIPFKDGVQFRPWTMNLLLGTLGPFSNTRVKWLRIGQN